MLLQLVLVHYLQDAGDLFVTTSSKDTRFAIWSTESLDKSSRSDFVSLSDKGVLCTQTWMDPNGSIVKAPPTQWCSDGSSSGNKKTNIAAIAGGVAAGVAFIVAAVIAFICCKRRRQNGKAATATTTAAVASSTVNSNVPATWSASSRRTVQESAGPHQTARHHGSISNSNGHGRPSLVMLLSGKSFASDDNVTEDVELGTAYNDSISDSAAKSQQRQAVATAATDSTNSSTTTGGGIRRGSKASSGGSSTAASGANNTTVKVDSKPNSSGLKAISNGVTSAVKAGIDKHGAKAGIAWQGIGAVAEHIPYVRFAYGKHHNTIHTLTFHLFANRMHCCEHLYVQHCGAHTNELQLCCALFFMMQQACVMR
jgi:cytoskeletal protein RodZ